MPDPCVLLSAKSEMRRQMKARRIEAFAKNKNAPFELRDQFLKTLSLSPDSIIAGYCARGSEMDPAPLMDGLRHAGHTIALPVMGGRGEPLFFKLYKSGDVLTPNAYGIGEPPENAPLIDPDILLVPLLAFDRQGSRLGTGGGYYDRTLEALRSRKAILAVGLGFSCQEVPLVPTASHDAPLDKIATEIQVF